MPDYFAILMEIISETDWAAVLSILPAPLLIVGFVIVVVMAAVSLFAAALFS